MKIGMVSTAECKCGIWTYSAMLSSALQQLDLEPIILGEFPYPNATAIDKSEPHELPIKYCWSRDSPYTQLINESKNYDLCHIQHQYGLFPNEVNYINLLKGIKKPLVLTLHDVVSPHPQVATYMSETIKNSRRLIVHTQSCYNLLEAWGCPLEKISLIPHGTKLIETKSKETARIELGLPENVKIILSWGFIWESKGILDLVKILAEVKKIYPEAIMVHAGGVHPIIQGSSYLKNIVKTAIQSGLSPKDLVITDWVPEEKVPVWLSTADVIVLNYMRGSASASGAAHRALAAHRPIVGTDDPCIEEIPRLVVPRFDIHALKDGIVKVLGDEVLQKQLIEKANKAAEETSWSNIALKHKELYNSLS